MIVLGLDPGTRHFGWGVVERSGTRLVHVAHGVVHSDEKLPIAQRLVGILGDEDAGVRAQMQDPEHMAGRDGAHQ